MPSDRRAAPLHAAQGLLMGAADVVPGVSGGTIALIVGIYERLIAAVRSLAATPVVLLRGLGELRAHLATVEWWFVLPLGAGILTSIGVGSVLIPPLLDAYPAGARAVFFGLILASLAVPWRRIQTPSSRSLLLAAVGAVVAFLVVGLPPRELHDPAIVYVFLAAMIAICAMILPGVSGSFLLLVLGVYEVTLRAISGLDIGYLGVFAVGAALGLGLFSRLLGALLERWHDATMAVLVGLMAGSLRALWPWLGPDREFLAPPDAAAVAGAAALVVVGAAVVTVLLLVGDRAADRQSQAS